MKRFVFFSLLFSLAFIIFTSCSNLETDSIDKNQSDSDSIEISIDSFTRDSVSRALSSNTISCKKNTLFTGSVSKNSAVKSVIAQVKHAGQDYFSDLKKAELSNGKWKCEISFDEEEALFLRFIVLDEKNQNLTPDAAILHLFINEFSDKNYVWYISRGNSSEYCQLMQKAELEALDFTNPENKDFAQNKAFTICIDNDENISVNISSILLRDEEGNTVCEIQNSSTGNDVKTFEVTEELLYTYKTCFGSGRHYFQVFYQLEDSEKIEINAGSFLWWPESDYPQVYFKDLTVQERDINLHTDEKLSVSLFDDDKLKEAYFVLLTDEELESLGEIMDTDKLSSDSLSTSLAERISAAIKEESDERFYHFTAQKEEREVTFSFTSPSASCHLNLFIIASDDTEEVKSVCKKYSLHVIDSSLSVLNIISPLNNEVPAVKLSDNGKKAIVTITGRTVDTEGVVSLKFVWVGGFSSDSDKKEKALSILSGKENAVEAENQEAKLQEKSAVWNVKLDQPENNYGFLYQSFSFDIDLLNDFMDESSEDKYFLVCLERKDGKLSYYEYKLLSDLSDFCIKEVELSYGEALTAVVTFNKEIIIDSSVSFNAIIANDYISENLSLPFKKSRGNTAVFCKDFSGDSNNILNGSVFYNLSSCIENAEKLTDKSGHQLKISSQNENIDAHIIIDTVPPKIISMTPSEETEEGSNVFRKGNVITLRFGESVSKEKGKIILRQVKGWAIPPVLSQENFERICSKIGDEGRNYLSRQENGSDMIDSELLLGSLSKYPNDTYHGTGQFVGPYKKSFQGLTFNQDGSSAESDLTTKYVLDFDIDIWETDEAHFYDKTFEKGFATQAKYKKRGYESLTNMLKVLSPDSLKKADALRTASKIRSLLEEAHYHERIVEVNSDSVELSPDGLSAQITFTPNEYEESEELPYGREWEVIIEKGTFSDTAGNLIGSGLNSASALINKNGKSSFFSDGTATPVIRVDRYSYGLGIWQSDKKGKKANQIMADTSNYLPQSHDTVKPSGYVRVRIDCESRGATINYAVTESLEDYEYSNSSPAENGKTISPVFAVGKGLYNEAFKYFVVANAEKEGFPESEAAFEGVYQTVVKLIAPKTKNGYSAERKILGQRDLSIHGRPLASSEKEAYISSFPLRDKENASPYLRRCYRENSDSKMSESLDYYWVSYEVLTDAAFSFYNWDSTSYDWALNSGIMKSGELTEFIAD